jgi:SAM-dependent methyltransferase
MRPTLIQEAERLYDTTADKWVRDEPRLMSDFIARPSILEECRPKAAQGDCLDLGCGEGYFTRMLARAGARSIVGSDVSTAMITRARRAEAQHPLHITYFVASITEAQPVALQAFDLVSAVHVINYLDFEHTLMAFRNVQRYLRPDGWFVFSVPHPFLVHHSQRKASFFFERPAGDYYSDRDGKFMGKVARIDGEYCDVLYYHKTFEDYLRLLEQAGFGSVRRIRELYVTAAHVAHHPALFRGQENHPFFAVFTVSVS